MYMNEYNAKEVLQRLIYNYVRPYKSRIFLAIFFMIIVAICVAIIVGIVEPIIDKAFLNKDKTMLYYLAFTMVLVSTIKGVAEFFQNFLIKTVGQRILSNIQIELYEHLLKSDIEFIHSQSSARLISRFTNDITLMRGAVSNLLVGVAKHFLTVLFLIILMFIKEPTLSCAIFFVFPIAIYPIQRNGKRIRKLATSAQEQLGNYTAKLDETFNSIKVVKSYQAEELEAKRAKTFIEHIFELYKNTAKYDALTSPIMETLSGIAIATIILYGGYLVAEGKTTTGALFAFMAAFVSAYRPYKSLVSFNINLQEGVAAASRLFNVLDQKPYIFEDTKAKDLDCKNASIELRNVILDFNTKRALDNLSLKIEPNSKIALVGKSGEGKTSIANLLLRFYDPTSGMVLINNTDIKTAKLSSIRSQISLVSQDTLLFDASIGENIAYNMQGATQKEIEEAARAASAHEFITNLPNGYDTIIGPQGRTLSGGQRQRLAIARAFLKNSPIIILDEATSSLDAETERDIKHAIDRLSANRTTIIITHKLNIIEDANMIYVVKHGKIVENGTHSELINHRQEYAALYKKQSSPL